MPRMIWQDDLNTGIKVKHDIIQEGDVVEKLQTSMQSGKSPSWMM